LLAIAEKRCRVEAPPAFRISYTADIDGGKGTIRERRLGIAKIAMISDPYWTGEEHGTAVLELHLTAPAHPCRRRRLVAIAERPVWRSYGDDPLPTPEDALQMSLRAFPSWFLRIECDRCNKVRMLNQTHATAAQQNLRLRDFIARARHEGCGGRALKAELLTGVEGVSSRPVRRIVLRAG
jgi:hypothetical protein